MPVPGRLVELGKREIWSRSRFGPSVPTSATGPSTSARRPTPTTDSSVRCSTSSPDALADGTLRPLPVRTYDMADAPAAFRWMAQARHIGKVVLRAPRRAGAAEEDLIGHARHERRLRADHDEVGFERACEVEQPLAVLGTDWVAHPEARDPGVSRCGVELVETRALPQLPCKRVLAAARADQEHPHVRASLLRSSEVSKGSKAANVPVVVEPGLDQHDWESEWQLLEPLVRDSPAEALPEPTT